MKRMCNWDTLERDVDKVKHRCAFRCPKMFRCFSVLRFLRRSFRTGLGCSVTDVWNGGR
jgi:hypothetical protein